MPKQSVPIMKICHTDINVLYFQIVVNYRAKSTEEKICYRLVHYHSLCLNDHLTCENNFHVEQAKTLYLHFDFLKITK